MGVLILYPFWRTTPNSTGVMDLKDQYSLRAVLLGTQVSAGEPDPECSLDPKGHIPH